jgi:hypothetical protein
MDITGMSQRRDESDRANSRIHAVEERLSRKIDYLENKITALRDSTDASILSLHEEITKQAFFWATIAYIGGLALLALAFHCLGGHPQG